MWLVARSSSIHLNGALKTTSSGCTKHVHLGGISAEVVLQSLVYKPSIDGFLYLMMIKTKKSRTLHM